MKTPSSRECASFTRRLRYSNEVSYITLLMPGGDFVRENSLCAVSPPTERSLLHYPATAGRRVCSRGKTFRTVIPLQDRHLLHYPAGAGWRCRSRECTFSHGDSATGTRSHTHPCLSWEETSFTGMHHAANVRGFCWHKDGKGAMRVFSPMNIQTAWMHPKCAPNALNGKQSG